MAASRCLDLRCDRCRSVSIGQVWCSRRAQFRQLCIRLAKAGSAFAVDRNDPYSRSLPISPRMGHGTRYKPVANRRRSTGVCDLLRPGAKRLLTAPRGLGTALRRGSLSLLQAIANTSPQLRSALRAWNFFVSNSRQVQRFPPVALHHQNERLSSEHWRNVAARRFVASAERHSTASASYSLIMSRRSRTICRRESRLLAFGDPAASIFSISATACASLSRRSAQTSERCADAASSASPRQGHGPATRPSGFARASLRSFPFSLPFRSSHIPARTRTAN